MCCIQYSTQSLFHYYETAVNKLPRRLPALQAGAPAVKKPRMSNIFGHIIVEFVFSLLVVQVESNEIFVQGSLEDTCK